MDDVIKEQRARIKAQYDHWQAKAAAARALEARIRMPFSWDPPRLAAERVPMDIESVIDQAAQAMKAAHDAGLAYLDLVRTSTQAFGAAALADPD